MAKNKSGNPLQAQSNLAAQEVSLVRKDILQTVVVNLIFLGLLIGTYYWNKSAGHTLDNFVKNLLN